MPDNNTILALAPAPPISTLHEPMSRDQRIDETVALMQNALYYEWLKAEREDYAEYMLEEEWIRRGC
jgi:hypothetical protein